MLLDTVQTDVWSTYNKVKRRINSIAVTGNITKKRKPSQITETYIYTKCKTLPISTNKLGMMVHTSQLYKRHR
jgi:hypothetical protein